MEGGIWFAKLTEFFETLSFLNWSMPILLPAAESAILVFSLRNLWLDPKEIRKKKCMIFEVEDSTAGALVTHMA